MRKLDSVVRAVAIAASLVLLAGCATVPYVQGRGLEDDHTLRLGPGEDQIEYGRPIPFVDGLGHYVLSLPSKLLLWDWRIDNHDVSQETVGRLQEYLDYNGLHNVKVRINQYAVPDEWRRLGRNNGIHPGWRYTLGVLSLVRYTVLPGRAFGGDHYNPYTNTINIYSDHKSIALHEAAHAKDFAGRPLAFRGFYAGMRVLPLVPLYHEAVASGDAIGYDLAMGYLGDERADYKILYPAYGTYIGGETTRWLPFSPFIDYTIQLGAVVTGHVAGRIKAGNVRDRSRDPAPSLPPRAAPGGP